jgi:outer membrane protein TolC
VWLCTAAVSAAIISPVWAQAPAQPGASAVPPPIQARRPVPLREALQLAAQQSPDVAIARAQAAIAEAGVQRAWTAWQPGISATGTYDRASVESKLSLGGIINVVGDVYNLPQQRPENIPAPVTIVGRNSLSGNVQFIQPLFTPQGILLIGPANRAAEAAQFGALDAREQILLGTARAYLGLRGIAQLMEAAREAEQVALRREKDAKAQLDVGLAVETALFRAQSETAVSRAQIADLEGTRESLLATLEALTGEAVQPDDVGEANIAVREPADPATSPWEQTFAVQSAAKQLQAVQGTVKYDHFAWLPTLAAGARGNYASNVGFAGVHTSYDLLLTLNFPLYDQGVRLANLREDEARVAQAKAALESNRARARSNWMAARANLESAKAVVSQAEAAAQLQKRVQQQVETSAKAGVATNLELSDADNKRFLADSAAAQARANFQIRRAELAAAEGRLYLAIEAPP